jgi:uncharacterized protein
VNELCGRNATPISRIQGRSARSPLEGQSVEIEAVLTADFAENGWFVQEEPWDEDSDPDSSEGMLIVASAATTIRDGGRLAIGQRLRARGTLREREGMTILDTVEIARCADSIAIAPRALTLPVASLDSLEALEGMRVELAQTLTVTGNFELGRYGALDLSAGGRLFAPTQLMAAGAAARAREEQNERSRIVLDDGSHARDPDPIPYLDASGTRRLGDQVNGLLGILDHRYGAYRVQPTEPPQFRRSELRPARPPAIAGRLRVASFNVFNYFTSLASGRASCAGQPCRGANSAAELARQREKLVSALAGLDADAYGLLELQNDGVSLADLVAALNARVGGAAYTAIASAAADADVIASAIVYRRESLSPDGALATLTRDVDAEFADGLHRPALAQRFVEPRSGARFTLVVVHLKSKSGSCEAYGDPDLGDGQGACNATRTAGARALGRFAAALGPGALLIGDFNAYPKEDPIAALTGAGLAALVQDEQSYSYQYRGQSGCLDQAFAAPALAARVRGVAHWHIAADEPAVLDYNTEHKPDDRFDGAQPFRASDHDPLLIGLELP